MLVLLKAKKGGKEKSFFSFETKKKKSSFDHGEENRAENERKMSGSVQT